MQTQQPTQESAILRPWFAVHSALFWVRCSVLVALWVCSCSPLSPVQPPYSVDRSGLSANVSVDSSSLVLLCTDGKGPLLEGEERVFPCTGRCPRGFDCEMNGGAKEGICCPNLSELYRLYKESSDEETDSAEEKGSGSEDRGGEQQPKSESGVDAMALLEQHYGSGIARPKGGAHSQPPDAGSDAAAAAALVQSRAIEIRRSQPKRRSFFGQQQPSSHEFGWMASSAARARSSKTSKPSRNLDASGEEYSCRRQRLDLFCEDGRRHTQFVMRWYSKEGVCISYPWGYCPGKPVASDPTLRTREECEQLCTDPLEAEVVSVARFGVGRGERVRQGQEGSLPSPIDLSQPEEPPSGGDPQQITAIPNASSFSPALPQKASGGEGPDGPFLAAAHHLDVLGPGEDPSSSEFTEFLFDQQQRQPPKKRCQKVVPYRAMCPDGMPSQFTLRWYLRGDGGCFAYPFGYCHGESVFAEEPIKTERECIEVCQAEREARKRRAKARV